MRQESFVCELEALSVASDRLVNQSMYDSTRISNLEELYKQLEASCRDLSTAPQAEQAVSNLSIEIQVLRTGMNKLFSDSEKKFGTRLADLERKNYEFMQGVDSTHQELKNGQQELESLLDFERKIRNSQIDSEGKSRATELGMLSNDLASKYAEAVKVFRNTNDYCNQLGENLTQLDAFVAELASTINPETMNLQFESLLASERTALRELVSVEMRELRGLSTSPSQSRGLSTGPSQFSAWEVLCC